MKRIISIDKFLNKRKIKPYAAILGMMWEKKAADVVAFDVAGGVAYADFVIVCSGSSKRHTQGIVDGLMQKAKEAGKKAALEGYDEGDWILIDLGDIIVHVFTGDTRLIYDVEGLWHDVACFAIKESEA